MTPLLPLPHPQFIPQPILLCFYHYQPMEIHSARSSMATSPKSPLLDLAAFDMADHLLSSETRPTHVQNGVLDSSTQIMTWPSS